MKDLVFPRGYKPDCQRRKLSTADSNNDVDINTNYSVLCFARFYFRKFVKLNKILEEQKQFKLWCNIMTALETVLNTMKMMSGY